jgi:hypothetical protein
MAKSGGEVEAAKEDTRAAAVAKGNQSAKDMEKWLKANKKKNAGLEAITIAQDRYGAILTAAMPCFGAALPSRWLKPA